MLARLLEWDLLSCSGEYPLGCSAPPKSKSDYSHFSASCETVAFALGAMVGMPAVKNFAIYAAGAVVINALLQVTIFVSAMAIDLRRVEVSLSRLEYSSLVGLSDVRG